jgi:mono/diheme cytochrome c family protein
MKNLGTGSGVRVAAVAALALLLATAPGTGQAEGEDVTALIERGQVSYMAHCAACHGAEGLGGGPVAQYLTVSPTDLTQLGVGDEFPFDEVYDVIDGREVPGHGTREMPVWGPALTGMDATGDRKAVKEKLVELVYFLKSMQ